MFLGRCGQERGAVTRSDGGASGTGRVELGKHPFFWARGVLLSRKSSLGLEYGKDQIKIV